MTRPLLHALFLAACALSACELVLGIGDTPAGTSGDSLGGQQAAPTGGRAAGGQGTGRGGGPRGGDGGRSSDAGQSGSSNAGASGAGADGDATLGGQLATGGRFAAGGSDAGGAGESAGAAGEASPITGGQATDGGSASSEGGSAGRSSGGNPSGGTGGGGTGGSGGAIVRPPSRLRTSLVQHPWPFSPIVCYEIEGKSVLDDATLLARRAFVHHARELVDANWVRNLGRIRYLDGWEDCVTRDGSIRVSISDSRSSTADLGFKGLYEVSQVTLNTAASDAEILHFFGRVLGLQNEFGFDVAPGPCIACDRHEDCTFADGLSCLADNMCGFDGDHDSIMAAPGCKGIEPWRRLTSWDVIGAQRAYGTKPPGALVYRNSLCVNIPNARVDDVSLIGYPCFSAPNDTWRFSFAATSGESDLLVAAPQGQDRCLTASVSGSALSLTCNRGDPAQNVQMIDMRWRAFGGTCVSPAGASDGSPLYTAECNVNSALQRWTIRDGRFQLSGTSLCASVDSASQDLNVLLKPCDEQDKTQQFVLRTGLIESGNLGCINVFGGDPTPGSKLSVWGFCSDQIENEAFYVTGAIRAGNGCLGMNDESQVTASACSQRSSQEWDYHF